MDDKFFIYKITNLVNGKIYIGKSQNNLKCGSTRWQIHLKIAKGGKKKYDRMYSLLHKAIKKYGDKNFLYEVIQSTNDESEALKLEMQWIACMKEKGFILYNLTEGGEGMSGFIHSHKSRKQIGDSQRGEKSSNAILTDEDVRGIKRMREGGVTYPVIAFHYGVAISTISMICNGKRWSHIT